MDSIGCGQRPRQACVVGAGVSGLVTAKRLKAEGLEVTVYERQSRAGGVWNYTGDPSEQYAGPMYDSLETNFPKELMQFDDFPWPENTSLFPEHRDVAAYLSGYEKHVGLVVQYDTNVVDIYRQTRLHPRKWRVQTEVPGGMSRAFKEFDVVVLAVGTFQQPFEPKYTGLDEWKAMRPNTIMHAKEFRLADEFAGLNVLVVGNSVTGRDISRLVSATAKNTWVSSRRVDGPWNVGPAYRKKAIKSFNAKRGTVQFQVDGKRRTDEVQIDRVIFCTGYIYSSPFLRGGVRALEPLFEDGLHIKDLWQHMMWTKEPTLAFVGTPKGGPSFLIAQAQSAYLARLYSPDCLGLGCTRGQLEAWVAEEMRAKGICPSSTDMTEAITMGLENMSMGPSLQAVRQADRQTDLHGLPFPACRVYIDKLEDWSLKADQWRKDPVPLGNQVYRWTDRQTWLMRNARGIRDAFLGKGEWRHMFSSPESLGFLPVKEEVRHIYSSTE